MEQTLQAAEEAVNPSVDGSESAPEGSEAPVTEEAQAPEETTPQEAEQEGGTPEWFQKAIDRQTFKYREEERKRQAVEAELEKVRQQMPQDARPNIPPIPDQFDEDYTEKLAERDKALKAATEWETRQALKAAVEQREAQRKQQEAQEAFVKTEAAYVSRAKELHVDANELASAGQYVGSYINPHVGQFILESEQGPLITTHLAKNPAELQKVATMPPMAAAAYIATHIAPNVNAKPQTTSAPKPPETLSGGGSKPERGPAGATYE